MPPDHLSLHEAIAYLGVTYSTLHLWTRRLGLRVVRVCKNPQLTPRLYYPIAELDRALRMMRPSTESQPPAQAG